MLFNYACINEVIEISSFNQSLSLGLNSPISGTFVPRSWRDSLPPFKPNILKFDFYNLISHS